MVNLFNLILVSIITLFQTYVFARLLTISWISSIFPPKGWIFGGLFLWGIFVLSRTVTFKHFGILYSVIEWTGMLWMGLVFLFFITFLAADIGTCFGFLAFAYIQKIRTIALCIGIIISVIAFIQGIRPPAFVRYDVYLPTLSSELNGTKLIALTDTHLGNILGKRWFDRIANRIVQEKPDLIVLVGDIFERNIIPPPQAMKMFSQLTAPMGVWAVLGNHDKEKNDHGKYPIEETSAKLLYNTSKEVVPGLLIAGVEDITYTIKKPSAIKAIETTLQNRPGDTTIYLSHVPWGMEIAKEHGVDLMISGHTHGGQLWPFTYLTKRAFTYFEGQYQIDSMALIVSRGTGTWGPRLRLWKQGEITEIILHQGTKPSS